MSESASSTSDAASLLMSRSPRFEGKDQELEVLAADWQAYNERWAAFTEKYAQPGVDPHTLE